MAGFCTKCGRPLQDGVPCSCTQTQSNAQPQTNQQPSNPQGAYQQPVHPQGAYQQPVHPQGAYQQPVHPQGAYQQPSNPQGAYQQQAQPQGAYQQQAQPQGAYQQPNNPQGTYQQQPYPQGAYQQPNYQQPAGNAGAPAGDYFNKFADMSKGLFWNAVNLIKCPYDTIKSILQGDPKIFGLGAILAKAIIYFFVILLSLVYLESQSHFGMDNKFKLTFTTTLMVVVMDFVLAGSMLLSTILFKKQAKFEAMLGVVGTKAVLDTIVFIVTMILALLSGTLAFYFFIVATLISFLFLIMAFNMSHTIDDNKKIYAMAVAIVISAIVGYILLKLFGGVLVEMMGFGGIGNSFNSLY